MSGIMQQMLLAGTTPPAPTLSFRQFLNTFSGGGANIVTASGMDVGTPSSDRVVFALVSWNNAGSGGSTKTLNSATIGGVAATIIVQTQGNLGSYWAGVAIISAPLPLGTTANVVMTFQSGAPFYNTWVATYATTGLSSGNTPTDTFSFADLSVSGQLGNLNALGGALVFCPIFLEWDTTSTLTGVTRNYNTITSGTGPMTTEGGAGTVSSANAAYPIQVSVGGTTNLLMVGAAFR